MTLRGSLAALTGLVLLLIGGCGIGEERAFTAGSGPRVGAYYYVWHDAAQWRQGYVGRMLSPPVRPWLGEYASADPDVAARHIAWASRYGIDFLAVSWTGRESVADRNLRAGLLAAPNLGDIRFAILYESLLALGGREEHIDFDATTTERLLADAEYLAREYFAHPQYLRIGDRPVLFLYVTRVFTGRSIEALTALRRTLRRRGHRVYLVADEVFWQWPRRRVFRTFDAITAYNMYHWGEPDWAGYPARSGFLDAVREQYRHYKLVANETGTVFIPSVIPGYNDRGIRPMEDHYVIPRRMSPEAAEGSVFARALAELGLAFLDDRNQLLLVTSFNEWQEWTQIEPARPSPVTARDTSGGSYTTGLPHAGYGLRYLELIREAVVGVSGQVLAATDRRPLAHAEVRAIRDGEVVATARADSAGYFRFGRGVLAPGRYEFATRVGRAKAAAEVGGGPAPSLELVAE